MKEKTEEKILFAFELLAVALFGYSFVALMSIWWKLLCVIYMTLIVYKMIDLGKLIFYE